MGNRKSKTISGKSAIIGAALCLMLASTAYAKAPKEEKLKQASNTIIAASNPITASVGRFTGDAVTPGFTSVGSFTAVSNVSPAIIQTVPAVWTSKPAAVSPVVNSSAASAAVIQSIPAVWTPNWTSKPEISMRNVADAAAISSNIAASSLPPSMHPAVAQTISNPQINVGNILASTSSGISNKLNTLVSKKDGSQSLQESAMQDFVNKKTEDQQSKASLINNRNVNALVSQAKQAYTSVKMMTKQAHSLAAKTASSVIDGLYAVKKSLSATKVRATQHIKFVPNLKNKAYEHTSGWIRGIIPILKLAIPSEELPLLMDLFILDNNALPVADAVNNQKDPLSPPVRKTITDGNDGNQIPLSADVSRAALGHINPTHTTFYIDMIKKNAVNYNKTGLSPPKTASFNSTALLSANDLSIRRCSDFGKSAYHAIFLIDSSDISVSFHPINHSIHPLSLLVSGEANLKDRGFCLYNNLKGGVS